MSPEETTPPNRIYLYCEYTQFGRTYRDYEGWMEATPENIKGLYKSFRNRIQITDLKPGYRAVIRTKGPTPTGKPVNELGV